MPMELCLEFVAVVGANRRYTEGELLYHMVDEVNGILLCVSLVDFQSADPGCVVNGGILEATHLLLFRIFEVEELHINLDVMAGYLFLVALRQHGPLPGVARQAIEAVAQEYVSHTPL